MKILIVDDNPEILDLMKEILSDEFEVLTANDGSEAFEIKNSDKSIRVILTDIQMPIMDGFELCRAIRKTDPLSIIIGITGNYGVLTAFEARDAGFDDIYTKPLDLDEIVTVVDQSFQKIKRWTTR